MEAGSDRLQQLGWVVLDREQEVAVGLQEHAGQGPLGQQRIGGEEPEERVVPQPLLQAPLQRLGRGRFAAGDGELSQAEVPLVSADVEHGDGIALSVVPRLAGCAVDGGRVGLGRLGLGGEPTREDVAELLQRASRQGAADRGGVRRLLAREAQSAIEGAPMVLGPPLEAGEVGRTAEQAEEGQRQQGRVGVADPPSLARIVDLAKGVEQSGNRSSHP